MPMIEVYTVTQSQLCINACRQVAVVLFQVYHEVAAWPSPTAGPLQQLQVGYSTLSSRLPAFSTLPAPSCSTLQDVVGVWAGCLVCSYVHELYVTSTM